jgi:hypothetical protein
MRGQPVYGQNGPETESANSTPCPDAENHHHQAWAENPPSPVPGVGQLTPAPTAARYGRLNDFIHIFSGKSQFYVALKFVLHIDIYSKEPVFLKQ